MIRTEVQNRGTRYIAYVTRDEDTRYILIVTNWSGNGGEWIALGVGEGEIAWSYLAEKLPSWGKRGGDKEGFVALFAEIGIEVFG